MKEQSREKAVASSTTIEQEAKLPKYESPKIEVRDEEELLNNVNVLGCSPFPPPP